MNLLQVLSYPYFLPHWFISQLLRWNIFQHVVLSDHTENSYVIVQTFFEGFWSEMKFYRSSAVRRGSLRNELIVRSLSQWAKQTLAESAWVGMTDEERVCDGGDGYNEDWREADWANGAHSEMRRPGVIVSSSFFSLCSSVISITM